MYHNTKNKGKTMLVDFNDDAGKDGNNIIDNEYDTKRQQLVMLLKIWKNTRALFSTKVQIN